MRQLRTLVISLLFLFAAAELRAACSSPAGVAGQFQWFSADDTIKYCNGSNWKGTENTLTGGKISCAGNAAGTINYSGTILRYCPALVGWWITMSGPLIEPCSVTAGTYNFDSATGMFRICNGTNWYDLGTPKRMFISQSVQDGAIGSAAAGDPICQADATSNSLGGTWKAWLSDSTVNAIDRIAEVGPWYRVDKTTRIAYNKAQLISGTLTNSIALYPDGTSSGSKTLWTGTTANGTVSIDTCVDWTVNTAFGRSGAKGGVGTADQTGPTWTENALSAICATGIFRSIICIEQ